jgi:hypothetical protein
MTELRSDEIITELRLPRWPAARRWGFEESRRALYPRFGTTVELGHRCRASYSEAAGAASKRWRAPTRFDPRLRSNSRTPERWDSSAIREFKLCGGLAPCMPIFLCLSLDPIHLCGREGALLPTLSKK